MDEPDSSHLSNKLVRILSGPLAGLTGYVANARPDQDKDKLEVGAAIFGHKQFIEVPLRDIEILDFKQPE